MHNNRTGYIILSEDILPGNYEANLCNKGKTKSQTQQVIGLMNVPSLVGDYYGKATIYRVNGLSLWYWLTVFYYYKYLKRFENVKLVKKITPFDELYEFH